MPGGRLRRAKLPAHRKAAGVVGEQRFAKALTLLGVPEIAEVFFSVPMPAPTRSRFGNVQRARDMDTDIDCVITTGNTMVLVDVKMFRAAHYYTTRRGHMIGSNNSGAVVSQQRMTRNMSVGAERFQGLFPHMLVIPAVVLMPGPPRRSAGCENILAAPVLPASTRPSRKGSRPTGSGGHGGPGTAHRETTVKKPPTTHKQQKGDKETGFNVQ